MSLNTDTLVIEGWPEPISIAFTDMKKLEVSQGLKSRVDKGRLYGALFGAGLGTVSGLTSGDAPGPGSAVLLAFMGSALCGGIGWYVGSFMSEEKWAKVPIEEVRLSRLRL